MSTGKELQNALFCVVAGSALLYTSLKKLKLRRKMADIPRSKISSLAIGNFVEIHGEVVCLEEHQIVSPLSESKCSTFVWLLERREGSGKRKRWVRQYTFFSTPYIYIGDDSGEMAAVDLSACEFQEETFGHVLEFDSGSFKIPDGVKKIFHKHEMLQTDKTEFFLFSDQYRIRERLFLPGESIYVLGAAVPLGQKEEPKHLEKRTKFGERNSHLKEKLANLFHWHSKDPLIVPVYDENKDSRLDEKEKRRLYADLKKDILGEFEMDTFNDYHAVAKVLLTKPFESDSFFKLDKLYLSNRSEKDLSARMSWWIWGVFAGPALVAIGIFTMLSVS